MAKFEIKTILSGFASAGVLDSNFSTIQTELNDKVLYRNNTSGEANQMEQDLDMNSNRIINLPDGVLPHEPLTVSQGLSGAGSDESALAAAVSASQAESFLNNFETKYLGSFATAPTVDNEGNAIAPGALYFNTTDDIMYIRNNSGSWQVLAAVEIGYKPVIPLYAAGTLDPGEVIVQYVAPQTVVLPINFVNSQAYCETAPTGSSVFTIYKNGVSVGTCTFAAASKTGTFSVAAPVTLAAGDRLTMTAPNPADVSLEQVSFTLRTEQITGALISKYAADFFSPTGTDTLTLAATGLTVAFDAYEEGVKIAWQTANVNTGPVTVNVAGLGAKALTIDGVELAAGQLESGKVVEARFDLANDRFYITNRVDTPALLERWRIGDIYTTTVATNPATTLGYGTWSAFGEGRVLVGAGTGNDGTESIAFTAGAQGGKYKHTLTVDEIPAHSHTGDTRQDGNSPGNGAPEEGDNATSGGYTTDETGGDGAHNNIQPYKVVYYWERTA